MARECDIILLSYESPDLLKKCVESVLEHTRVSSRLIIVDNASGDPKVASYLQEVHGNEIVEIEKVFSEENVGFAAGMNRGMRLSEAPFVCLLNNDCIVTDGWLEEMIAVAGQRNDIGLVNPQSNTFGSRPEEGATIDYHAAFLSDKKGGYTELGHAIGFACLIKREVIDRIGCLDEVYLGVCYEDTDFSVRAQKTGFISVMAEGAYVYHAEQASRRNLEKKEEVYRRNKEIFECKWGKLLRVFYIRTQDSDIDHVLNDYEILKGLARERAFVDMWVGGAEFSPEEITRKTMKHADISINIVSDKFLGISSFWRILIKKKKYDAVITDNERLLRRLRFLKPLLGAKVFPRKDLEEPSILAESLRKGKP
jgi:GT2 family glycosyltransferase